MSILVIASSTMSLYVERSLDDSLCVVGNGCLAAAQSKFSKPFGVQASLLATLWTVLVAGLVAFAPRSPGVRRSMAVLAGTGAASAILMQAFALNMGIWCIWCALCAVAMILIAAVVFKNPLNESSANCSPTNLGPKIALGAIAFLGLIPYAVTDRMVSPVRTYAWEGRTKQALLARLASVPLEKAAFIFTDFACPICHERMPKIIAKIEAKGLLPVFIPVTVKSESGTDLTAALFYVALRKGYGRQFIERFPGVGTANLYNETAKVELKPSEKQMKDAFAHVGGSNALFRRLKIRGTPYVATVRGERLLVASSPDLILGVK